MLNWSRTIAVSLTGHLVLCGVGQCLFENPPQPSGLGTVYESRNGFEMTPHGEVRILFVFAEIEYTDPFMDPLPRKKHGNIPL